jgi:glycerophosphoryl diester phosphodiesterase
MPENTLAGVDAALKAAVDAIEIDVRATSDGVVVLTHDETLERVAGDARAVAELTAEELRGVALLPAHGVAGQYVPTLAEVFELVAGQAIVVVEVKQRGIHDLVAAEVRRAEAAPWTWLWTFDPTVARECRRVLPEVPASLLVAPGSLERCGFRDTPIEMAVREGFAAVSWHHTLVDASTVDAARRRGLASYCWTPNAPEDIARVIEAGVDGVCSNFPDRVQSALAGLTKETRNDG